VTMSRNCDFSKEFP